MLLQLKNNNQITFINPADVTASDVFAVDHYYRLRYWSAETIYVVSYRDLNKLASSDFTGARMETDMGNLDFAMSSGESKTLNKLAALAIKAGTGD